MKKRHRRLVRMPLSLCVLTLFVLAGCAPGHEEHDEHEDHEGHAAHAPAAEHSDEENHVELTEKQFHAAQIEILVAGPLEVSVSLTLPGTVAPNSDAVLHVTPRVSGQVRSVHKQLGDTVEDGELLCVIDSVELGGVVADYLRHQEVTRAAAETLKRGHELYASRIEALTAVLNGAIAVQEHIFAREKDLQEKAVSTIRPLLEAEKALELARLEKDRQLAELRAERDSRLLELEVSLRTQRIDLTAARSKIRTLGLSEEILDTLTEESPLLAGEFKVHSPGTGVVVNRHASTGEFVAAGSKLFIIEDLSNVWFVASAFEQQLRSLRSGQTAFVSLDAFPDTTLNGTVSFLDYHVDPTSRSVGVRIMLDNSQLDSWPEELPLRPGMFGRVELVTSTRQAAVVLPERALVHDDRGDSVFVQVEPFAFEHRDVTVSHVAGDLVEITSGLEAGERVAASGTFLLKSAGRQGELGGGHSH